MGSLARQTCLPHRIARSVRFTLIPLIITVLLNALNPSGDVHAQSARKFVSGYYPNWSVWSYPPEEVDYDALTHVLHFHADVIDAPPYLNILATPAATTEWETAGTGRNHLRSLLDSAHAHGTKVLLSIANVAFYGGNNAVMSAITADSVKCQTFVNNALNYCRSVGYDGIDINWEWPNSSDRAGYSRMMRMFRRGMDAWPERGTLSHTIYVLMSNTPGNYGAYDVPLLNQIVDQHNMECYGLGFWQSNRRFGYTFALNPAVQTIEAPGGYNDAISMTDPTHNTDLGYNTGPAGAVRQGWARDKIGVGVGFLYYHSTSPEPLLIGGTNIGTWQNYYRFYYGDIIGTRAGQFGSIPRQWNNETKSPYKKWTANGVYNFVTYEDSLSLALKARSAIDSGYGGMMIYELSTGYINTDGGFPWSVPGYTGVKDPLLKAIKVEMGMTGGVNPDNVNPVVSLSAPGPGATVSGTVELSATASDDRGAPRVLFTVDGNPVGSTVYGAPYRVSWNTAAASNGSHTVRATATDNWGNQAMAQISVTVSNAAPPNDTTGTDDSTVVGPPVGATSVVYDDGVNNPWFDASWNSVNTPASTEQILAGAASMKAQQLAWGALRFRLGSWAAPETFDPRGYTHFEFSVYPLTEELALRIFLDNDNLGTFQAVDRTLIQPGRWTKITVPIADLNPEGNAEVHDLVIQNLSAFAHDYFIDQTRFIGGSDTAGGSGGGGAPVVLSPPVLLAPSNGASGLPTSPSLEWATVAGATGYLVQLAVSSSFTPVLQEKTVTGATSTTVDGLASGATYYWRMRALGPDGPSQYTAAISFSTASAVTGLKYDRLMLDFGMVPVGSFKVDSVNVVNETDAAVTIEDFLTQSGKFVVTMPVNTVGARSSAKLYVLYQPTQRTEDSDIGVAVTNPSVSVDTFRLEGRGGKPARNRRWRPTIAIGTIPVGIETADSFTVVNEGEFNLKVKDVKSNHPAVMVSPSSAIIRPGDSLRFSVKVSPMVEGEIDGDLEFNDNGADSDKRLKVTATAVGTPPPGPVADVPAEYGLAQNYPNPFNPSTTIGFAVPTPGRVKIEVFDVTGRLVGLLLDDVMSEGVHAINWGATAPNGSRLPSGVYMYRMSGYPADGSRAPFSEVRKMVLLY